MKALCIGLLLLAVLMLSGVLSTSTLTGAAKPQATLEQPLFAPLTQDLGPLIDLLD